MKNIALSAASVIVLVFANGCSGTLNEATKSQTPEVISAKLISTPLRDCFGSIDSPMPQGGVTSDEYNKMIRNFYEVAPDKLSSHYKTMRAISLAESWQRAHSMSQQFLTATQQEPIASYLRQQIAVSMLRTFLIDADLSPEVSQATEYYLKVLIDAHYYGEPNLFAQILYKMNSYWSKEHVAEVASQCAVSNSWVRGNQIIASQYFQNKAKAVALDQQSSSKSLNKIEQELRQQFETDIPSKLKNLRSVLNKENGIKSWFDSKAESVLILSFLGENMSGSNNK